MCGEIKWDKHGNMKRALKIRMFTLLIVNALNSPIKDRLVGWVKKIKTQPFVAYKKSISLAKINIGL
jgi:hypothetical protein